MMKLHNSPYPKMFPKELIFTLLISLLAAFLLLQFSFFAAIFIFLLGLTLLFAQNKNFLFYFLLFLVPVDRFYFPVIYRLKAYQIVLVGVVILGIVSIVVNKKKFRFNWNLLDVSILLIYFGRILSGFVAVNYAVYFKALILYGFFVLLYFYIRANAESIKPEKMLRYMIYTSAIFIGFGFFEFILGKFGIAPLRGSEAIYVYAGRPWSVFREPDWFGGYLTFIIGLTFPFAYSKFKHERMHGRNRLILYFALLMSLIIVVRSAWLGLIIGVLFVFIVTGKKIKKITLSSIAKTTTILFACLILLFSFSITHYKSVQDRFVSVFTHITHRGYDPAAQVRLNSYEIISDYIQQKPIQGYGAGAWEFLSKRHEHINPSLSTNIILFTPIFEMGILGVVLYLIFIFALFKMAFSGIKRASTETEHRCAMGIMIAVVGTLVVCIFNDIMLTGFYWAFIAIFNNYVNSLKKTNENITHSS